MRLARRSSQSRAKIHREAFILQVSGWGVLALLLLTPSAGQADCEYFRPYPKDYNTCLEHEKAERATQQEALRKEKQEQEQVGRVQEELARERSKALLSQCLDNADTAYRDRWNSICAFENRPNGCFLPAESSGNLDQSHRGSRDECIKLYPLR